MQARQRLRPLKRRVSRTAQWQLSQLARSPDMSFVVSPSMAPSSSSRLLPAGREGLASGVTGDGFLMGNHRPKEHFAYRSALPRPQEGSAPQGESDHDSRP